MIRPVGSAPEPMQESDLAEILALERRAYPYPWTEGILRDSLRAGYSGWVVRDADGHLCAYAFMSMAVGEAHILNLCVDPQYQRQGLGRRVLGHLKSVAGAAGVQLMLLEVRKSNHAAISLYLRSGFQRLGQRKNYYPADNGSEDAWLLGHELPGQPVNA